VGECYGVDVAIAIIDGAGETVVIGGCGGSGSYGAGDQHHG
jgi:hypothetical protein